MTTTQSKMIGLISLLFLATSAIANPLSEVQYQAKIANEQINIAMDELSNLPGYGRYVQLTRDLMQEVVFFRNRMENYMAPDEVAQQFDLVKEKYRTLRDKFRSDYPAQKIPPLSDSFHRIRASIKRMNVAVKHNGGVYRQSEDHHHMHDDGDRDHGGSNY